jgi:Ca2+-binding EF-hand superfamily protein
MRLSWQMGLAFLLFAASSDAQAQMRFAAMDTNNDGVITREEWRGNNRSFWMADWNGDGVLSGDEVRPGARRQTWDQDWNRDGRVDNEDRQIAQRFRGYDMNDDGRVVAREWPGDRRLYERLDANRDGFLTFQEYLQGAGYRLDAQGGPAYGFSNLDRNRDGWIIRSEWPMSAAEFDRFDVNHDNRINQNEFENVAAPAQHSAAWQRGHDRGQVEGRTAGREDYVRRRFFDLDGQTELERADSGYNPQMGSLSDYQAGYREGFRSAYRAGFEEAKNRR